MLWYLSFVGEDRWLGGAFVPGDDLVDAAKRAHVLGCNPGGEVMGHPIPDDVTPPPEEYIGKLLDKETLSMLDKRAAEADGYDGPVGAIKLAAMDPESRAAVCAVGKICDEHNKEKPS